MYGSWLIFKTIHPATYLCYLLHTYLPLPTASPNPTPDYPEKLRPTRYKTPRESVWYEQSKGGGERGGEGISPVKEENLVLQHIQSLT